jgi:putative membrane protein
MKSLLSALLVGTALLSPIAFAAAHPHHTTGAASATTISARQEDGAILKVVIVLNKNEIAAAEEVLHRKNINPHVRAYAKLMVRQHSQNLENAYELSSRLRYQPVSSHTSIQMKAQGTRDVENLASLKGAHQFQTAYINDMVTGHAQALKMFDTNLMKNATNPMLKRFLTNTRSVVAQHLQKAKQVQDQIG